MKRIIIFVLMIMGLTCIPANAVPIIGTLGSGPDNCGSYTAPEDPARVFMVGDSITAGGKADLLDLKPNWDIEALAGRNVDCLPGIVAERLTQRPMIGKLIIALGTNATEGWKQTDYEAVTNMVPSDTVVVFVTTYRDPQIWDDTMPYRTRASVQYWYSRYMNNIERPNTCLVPWRWYADNHPEVLADGVHPTIDGRKIWAKKVSDTVGDCWATP